MSSLTLGLATPRTGSIVGWSRPRRFGGFCAAPWGAKASPYPCCMRLVDKWESPPTDRLLSELDVGELRPAAPSAAETEQYSRLLYWCSAIGSGGLDRIRQVCQMLGHKQRLGWCMVGSPTIWSSWDTWSSMAALRFGGASSRRRWLLRSKMPSSRILVGQRTPAIVQYLRDRFQLEECPQPNGPPRLLIQGAGREVWYGSGRRVQDVGCVSRQLSRLLPTLNDWILPLAHLG